MHNFSLCDGNMYQGHDHLVSTNCKHGRGPQLALFVIGGIVAPKSINMAVEVTTVEFLSF